MSGDVKQSTCGGISRSLSAIPPEARVALFVLSVACAVTAQKTNDPPRGASAPHAEQVGKDPRSVSNGGDAIAASPVVPRCGDGVSPSLLTAADYEAGFALAEARYNEAHDFSPPEGAVICDDWRAFGAAYDWFKADFGEFAFPFGTNVISSLMVYSFGEARAAPRDF